MYTYSLCNTDTQIEQNMTLDIGSLAQTSMILSVDDLLNCEIILQSL